MPRLSSIALTASAVLSALAFAASTAAGASACSCVGDLDASGSVDGSDLGLLLASWGGPDGDLSGDGVTDGADLGALLAAWGPCVGAPVNDLCENALPIVDGETPFCTLGAGTEVPPFSDISGCIEYGYDSIYADVWYSFVAPSNGVATVSTCGTPWDTRLAVYKNFFLGQVTQCPSNEITFTGVAACNDDYAPCVNASQVSFATLGGFEYKIRVGGYIGWAGEGVLHLDFDPEGGSCEDAIDLGEIFPGATTSGTTLDDDQGDDESPCALGDTVAQWYRFSAEGCFGIPLITITTCSDDTDFDTTLSVWKADPSGCIGEFIACNDDFASPDCQLGGLNRKSRVEFSHVGAGFFYVRVAGYNGAQGNFELKFDWECQ